MPDELPPDLARERDAVIAQIYEAFADVTREGGVSWRESFVIDDYGTDDERAAARGQDHDMAWQELVDDTAWDPECGSSGFSFLDRIAFRYFLAPAMVRCVREGNSDRIPHWLRGLPLDDFGQGSKLDEPQCRCIARFIRFMIAVSEQQGEDHYLEPWQEALACHWHKFG